MNMDLYIVGRMEKDRVKVTAASKESENVSITLADGKMLKADFNVIDSSNKKILEIEATIYVDDVRQGVIYLSNFAPMPQFAGFVEPNKIDDSIYGESVYFCYVDELLIQNSDLLGDYLPELYKQNKTELVRIAGLVAKKYLDEAKKMRQKS